MNENENAKRDRFSTGIIVGSVLTLALLLIVGGIIAFIIMMRNPQMVSYHNTEPTAPVSAEGGSLNMPRIETKLFTLQDIVNKFYLFEQNPDQIEDSIYKGFMAGIGDNYAAYYSPDEYQKLNESFKGVFCGIGAVVQQDKNTNTVSVIQLIKDSPAEKAGVQVGDIIYKVGDTMASTVDLDTLVYDLIRGEKGTDVTITFIRDGKEVEITITRGEVADTTVYSEMKDDNIGYIEVSQFNSETTPEFIDAIDKLIKDGAKGLIIDLRDNPGGVLTACVEMADYILPDEVEEHDSLIVYTANRDGVGERYYTTDGHQVDTPIVILVNGNSASASEVFTGAMLDYEWATVVGTQTFGKGIVQNVLPLNDGSAVKLTTEHYYTPDGFDLHGEGLKPTIELEINEACKMYTDSNDNQYAKALEILKK